MKKSSIRKKLLISMVGLVSILLLLVTLFEIDSVKKLSQEGLDRRIKLMKRSVNEQGKAISSQIAVYAENAIASYNFFNISRIMEDMVKENKNLDYGILVDNSRIIHVHTEDHDLLETRLDSESDKFILQQTELTVKKIEKNGVSYLEFITPISIGNEPWGFLHLGFSLAILNAEIHDSKLSTEQHLKDEILRMLGLFIFCLLVGSLLIVDIAKRITSPLHQLTEFSTQLAEGNFNAKVPKEAQKANDETGLLSRTFVGMIEKVMESRARLEDYSKSLEREIIERKRSEKMINNIARGISAETGDAFFTSLVQYLANTLDMAYVFIGKLVDPENKIVRTIALYANGKVVDNIEYNLTNAPCENVLKEEMRCYPIGVQGEFPLDYLLKEMGVESYCGITLCDSVGKVLGILAVMDSKPIKNQKMVESLIRIFAVRAAAELERLKSEEALNQKTKLIQLLQEIAVTANEAPTIEEAMHVCLEKICVHTGWPIGHVYETDSQGVRLIPTKIWQIKNPERFGTFREITELTSLDRGDGLPGRVLESGKPCWVSDVTEVSWFQRAKSAKNIGVKAGFGFPVLEGKNVVAVLEFYSEETTEPDKSLLEALSHLAVQIGRVTGRKRMEEELLRVSEEKTRLLLNSTGEGIYGLDLNGNCTFINPSCVKMLGYVDRNQLINKNMHKLIHHTRKDGTPYPEQDCKIYMAFRKGKGVRKDDEVFWRPDGTSFPVEYQSFPIFEGENITGSVVTFVDISDRLKAQEVINSSLQEKDVLLREIHHRVKNNMHVIISLLGLQSRNLKDEKDIKIFKQGQERIRSMALIHEKLYESKNMSKINAKNYIESLVKELLIANNIKKSTVEVLLNIEPISLNIDSAIPLGLVLNELLSNVFNHAFPDNKKGYVEIFFRTTKNNEIELIVGDDGVSLPENYEIKNSTSLGLKLINGLVVNQLKGKIEVNRNEGTEFKIRFKEIKKDTTVFK